MNVWEQAVYWSKFAAAGIGGLLTYIYGGWSTILIWLVIVVAFDYVSGCVAAVVAGEGLKSKTGWSGIARKGMIFIVVGAAHGADILAGTDGTVLRDTVIAFYLSNEVISIIENAGKTGLPIPDKLRDAIAVLKKK